MATTQYRLYPSNIKYYHNYFFQVKVKDKVLDTITSSSYITTSTSSQYFQVEVIKQPSQFNPDMENPTQPVSWSTWTSQVKSEDGITVYDKTGLYADTVYIDNLHDVQVCADTLRWKLINEIVELV